MRDYAYRDLDHDGTFELVETSNALEERAPGWLNGEIAQAFDLHRIYAYRNGRFTKNYPQFAKYLNRRTAHYEFWKRQLAHPEQLPEDSQDLAKANQVLFQKELDRLIALMQ